MEVIKNCVLLLKAQKSHEILDKFEVTLVNTGFKVLQIKTLDFVYKNLNDLSEKLKNPDNYSGIILSSPRCVIAAHQATEIVKIDNKWLQKDNYCVGETTYEMGMKMLGLNCDGKDTGNSNNLAELILKDKTKYNKPFLFPHGNLKTDTLKRKFEYDGLTMDEVLVYETISNPNLEKEFADVTSNFTCIPEIIVFFSPSGVKSTIEFIKRIEKQLNNIKFVAIGPVTETSLLEEGIKVHGTALRPTPDEVIKAISNC